MYQSEKNIKFGQELLNMKIKVQRFTFNPFQENTYILSNDNKQCIIIDPGCYEDFEKEQLKNFIHEEKLTVLALLNTHCHIDHVLGNAFVKKEFEVDFYMHEWDVPTLNSIENYAHVYGIGNYELSPDADFYVSDNQVLNFGGMELTVIFGPGHAPGHVAFYNKENKILIGGDILFQGSFGRVDLPGGSMEILKETMHTRIFTLDEDTIVYPGHGPTTTIGEEKKSNYILNF